MKIIYLIFLVLLVPNIYAQNTTDFDEDLDFDSSDTSETTQGVDLGVSILTALLNSEPVKYKLSKIYDIIDLKIRFVKLVNSLLTRENFILVRRVLDLIVRVCNFFLSFLPEDSPAPGPSFLQSLFPVFQLNVPESAPVTLEPVPAASENEISITRVNRSATFSEEEKKLIEDHREDVVQLAKLIYKTP